MKHPVTVEIESQTMTVDTTQQVYYRVQENEKSKQLNRLLLVEQPESCVIFCNTRFMVDKVQRFLSRKGYACRALHGDIPQITRMKTLEQFKQGNFHLLVATDVAARGLHIDDLSLVINYDVPIEKDSYVHRIGRTGRAGNVGRAISLVTGEDIMTLYEIEEHIGVLIEEMELPSEAVINEHRASADKWIQANSLKRQQSPGATPKSNVNRNQRKHSHTRSPQHHEKHREWPSQINRDRNTSPGVNKTHIAQQAKPAPTISKPATLQSREINVVKDKPGPEIVHTQDKPKKPFYQRLLQRILGR